MKNIKLALAALALSFSGSVLADGVVAHVEGGTMNGIVNVSFQTEFADEVRTVSDVVVLQVNGRVLKIATLKANVVSLNGIDPINTNNVRLVYKNAKLSDQVKVTIKSANSSMQKEYNPVLFAAQ